MEVLGFLDAAALLQRESDQARVLANVAKGVEFVWRVSKIKARFCLRSLR